MLDGAARIPDSVDAAVQDGQPGLGITDHGNLYGLLPHYERCREVGISPILGIEAYMSGGDRTDRHIPSSKDDQGLDVVNTGSSKSYYHLLLMAENNAGYKNLMRLSTESFLTGYYMKPRVDWDLLEQYHEGLIATSGCLGGMVLQSLLHDNYAAAMQAATRLQDIFGKDNFFVELQDHGLPEQSITNPQLIQIAKAIGAPLVATNDSHYVNAEDAHTHDILLCIQTSSKQADAKRFKFSTVQHWLKTSAEMRALFSEVPEACDNTLWIAERNLVDLDPGTEYHLPVFDLPPGYTSQGEFLRHLTMQGMRRRYGDNPSEEVLKRVEYELEVIDKMGFSSYFNVVWDLYRHAKEAGVQAGPGRGSAAGSVIAYCLGICQLDPIHYGLLFERFLNPGRKQMPDIDCDFDEQGRLEMLRYSTEKYGRDHVAQIITFNTIKARAAVRDACRVLGYPYAVGDAISKAMPPLIMGRDTPLKACLELTPGHEAGYAQASALRAMYAEGGMNKEIIDAAVGLEGLKRSDGIHGAAVLIGDKPLVEYMPLQRKSKTGVDIDTVPIVTQYDMHYAEWLKLCKLDYLGLRNLSVLQNTVRSVERTAGVVIDINAIPVDDAPTYELLSRGDTVGVFQLESTQIRALTRSIAPSNMEDITALLALYRPGPMAANMHNDYADYKHQRKPVITEHPDLGELLKDTYGLMIYQESIMKVAQKFAGYSLAEADDLRKACGKKIKALVAQHHERFVKGCVEHGYTAALGERLFAIIEPFSDYAFNKSHALAYGFITYQTAWLKCHWPSHYMAALLTSVADKPERIGYYMAECRTMGLKVMVPDINQSEAAFTVEPVSPGGWGIRFGLSAITGAGSGIVGAISAERERGGPFMDFVDFCKRMGGKVDKGVMESIISAGAFDNMGYTRRGLYEFYDGHAALLKEKPNSKALADGPSLFDRAEIAAGLQSTYQISTEEWPRSQKLFREREALSFFVSDHPLAHAKSILDKHCNTDISAIREEPEVYNGREVVIGGIVIVITEKRTKKGDLMAVLQLQGMGSSIEITVFPHRWTTLRSQVDKSSVIAVRGKVQARGSEVTLLADEVRKINVNREMGDPIDILIGPEWTNSTQGERKALIGKLRQVCLEHPGAFPVFLSRLEPETEKYLQIDLKADVDFSPQFIGDARLAIQTMTAALIAHNLTQQIAV